MALNSVGDGLSGSAMEGQAPARLPAGAAMRAERMEKKAAGTRMPADCRGGQRPEVVAAPGSCTPKQPRYVA